MSLQMDDQTPLDFKKTAPIIDPKPVPGDSPAVYVGDPSNDLLVIHSLDLIPNPPVESVSVAFQRLLSTHTFQYRDFTVLLTGHLTADIGGGAVYKLTAFLNGTVGPSGEGDLFDEDDNLEMWQHGELVRDHLVQGPVIMSFSALLPVPWMDKGYYKVQTGMWAGPGKRMTVFEGTLWIQGENEGSGWDASSVIDEL